MPTDDAPPVPATVPAPPVAGRLALPPFLARLVAANRAAGIPRLLERLDAHGVIANFAAPPAARQGLWFTDSDLYKWIEAAAWAGDVDELEPVVEAVLGAQSPDGYLNTNFGRDGQLPRWHDLSWSHELYCAGHFVQAAVARFRSQGRSDLLDAAERFADCIARELPAGARDRHPVIEMALVDLYRVTGKPRHLDLAVDLADRVEWRGWDRLEGHAVCALYFASGMTDLAVETGDAARVAAVRRWYEALLAESVYLTGAVGGRWVAEAVGEPYELPQARSYTETCAAVAAIQWHERMHRLTADPRALEWRTITLHNAFAAGVGEGGDEWFYATPQATSCRAEPHPWIGDRMPADIAGPLPLRRAPWRDVTCCPPNAARLLAALPHSQFPVVVPDSAPSDAQWVEANHRVESLRGAVALSREPFVYCFEQIDQPDGIDVRDIAVDVDAPVVETTVDGLDVVALRVQGFELRADSLYRPLTRGRACEFVAIPYPSFARRGPSPMITWVSRAPVGTTTG